MTLRSDKHGSLPSATTANGETSRFRTRGDSSPGDDTSSNSDDRRPLTAPGRRNGAAAPSETRDGNGRDRSKRPPKPQLLRSKSDYQPRHPDDSDPADNHVPAWGARHGFEDHYQSEHIISQLVNVGGVFPDRSNYGGGGGGGGSSNIAVTAAAPATADRLLGTFCGVSDAGPDAVVVAPGTQRDQVQLCRVPLPSSPPLFEFMRFMVPDPPADPRREGL